MGRIALALFLMLVGCARAEPPAPIVDRTRTEPSNLASAATGLLNRLVGYTKPASDVLPVRPRAAPGQQIAAAVPKKTTPPAIASKPNGDSYLVRRGDTVYQIARLHSLTAQNLIDANRLKPPYRLRVGQRVAIPSQHLAIPSQRQHMVSHGETLYGVSQRYRVGMTALAQLNRLQRPYSIVVGQRLTIPGPGNAEPPAQAVVIKTALALPDTQPLIPKPRTRPVEIAMSRPPQPRLRPNPPTRAAGPIVAIGAPPPRAGNGFAWPVRGKLLTQFGAQDGDRHNDGLNIAAPRGTPVQAAENGIVAYAGNEIRGFGNLILLKHDGGMITAYAHADALLVRRGDVVNKGQIIARVGSSGGVDAPQLHFEIRRGAQAVDPAPLLVSRSIQPLAHTSG